MFKVTCDIYRRNGIQRREFLFPERDQKIQAAELADELLDTSPDVDARTVVLEDLDMGRALNFTAIALLGEDDGWVGRHREWMIAEDATTTGLHMDVQSTELPPPEVEAAEAGEG